MPDSLGQISERSAQKFYSQYVRKKKDLNRDLPVIQWETRGIGMYRASGPTVEFLPAGIYSVTHDDHGLLLVKTEFPTDELIRFPDGPVTTIIEQVEKFWAAKEKYERNGLLHKRGILLFGPAGCGKTSIIKLTIDDLISRDGIILVTDKPSWMPGAFRMVRGVEPDRPIINIIEDIDEKLDDSDDETAILAMLDGEHQINNILHIGTSNYPEKLEERISQRPGRFDYIVEMGPPSALAREAYLTKFAAFADCPKEKMKKWVKDTEGLGIAHLREMVAAVECLELDYNETLVRLKQNKKKPPKRRNIKDVGFTSAEDAEAISAER